jgi:hypothetical protein
MAFTTTGAKKIAQATREFLRKPKNQSIRGKRGSSYSDGGRWAKITAKSGKKYDWVSVKPTEEGWEEMPAWGQGSSGQASGYAMESEYRSEWVLTDSIVWIDPCVELNCYLFSYSGGVQVGKNNSYITAGTESNPGGGSVTVQVPPETGMAWEDGDIVDVINPFAEITGDNWVQITYGRGVWQVTAVECGS